MNFSSTMLLDSDVRGEGNQNRPAPWLLRRRSFPAATFSVLEDIGELKGLLLPGDEAAELLEPFGDHVINVDARVNTPRSRAGRQAPWRCIPMGRDAGSAALPPWRV